MASNKNPAEDSIVNFIDDDEYYRIRKYRSEIENGALAIYLFASVSLLNYLFYFLLHTETFDWLNLTINLCIIAIYFFLGVYSNQKPFTAFVAVFCAIAFVFLLNIFLNVQPNFSGIIIKIILIVYLSIRLEAAKAVQSYESKLKK